MPSRSELTSLDPAQSVYSHQADVVSTLFERLTRTVEGARVVPWLAEEMRPEDGSRRFRFRLREGIRFHDGRRLTARDIRYSFERLSRIGEGEARWQLAVVKGAQDFIDGRASGISGIEIHTASELSLVLEEPCPFFPAIVSNIMCAIVPEGMDEAGINWRDGMVGTGPFRLKHHVADRVEVERNPDYWREGYPRCQGIIFDFRVPSERIIQGFKSGEYSLLGELTPNELRELRREMALGTGYKEAPALGTAYVAFNIHRGPLKNLDLRRRLARATRVPERLRAEISGFGKIAQGIIPPGLLGHDPAASRSWPDRVPEPAETELAREESVELSFGISQSHVATRKGLFDYLKTTFEAENIVLKVIMMNAEEIDAALRGGEIDLIFGGWISDFPDSHSMVQGLLHSRVGRVGQLCGSEELDALLVRAQVEVDPTVRDALYREVENLITREALILPLYHEQIYRLCCPELEGLMLSHSSPSVPYEELSLRRST